MKMKRWLSNLLKQYNQQNYWHQLEDKYVDKIPDANEPREFRMLLKEMSVEDRVMIAKEICAYLLQEKDKQIMQKRSKKFYPA